MFGNDWLPHISVVSLPESVRCLDHRAIAVGDLDFGDYPAAALAALLSPCILLTGNHHHFAPLGISYSRQFSDALIAAIDLRAGEYQIQGIIMVPAAPVYAAGAATKWAYGKVGPVALLLLAAVIVSGVFLYRRQPTERREAIRIVAGRFGEGFMEQYAEAQRAVNSAQNQLFACLVPPPDKRSIPSAVLRLLATACDSMSAEQISEGLPAEVQPSVDTLRRWMQVNKPLLFSEARRGSFRLGNRYSISIAAVDSPSGS
jgi:hypothetical protein